METDFCDRCGAAGKVQIILANGRDLVFCGHHARENRAALDIASEVIYNDDTMMNDLQPA